MFTEFRAFTEFGFIAGSGILLTFLMMYSVFPALLVLFERLGWRVRAAKENRNPSQPRFWFNPLAHKRLILAGAGLAIIFSLIPSPRFGRF